jgi:hypothetical protein
VGYDTEPVAGIDDLHRLLTATRVGMRAMLTVIRQAATAQVEIVPEEARPAR